MGEWDPVGLEPKGGALVPDPAWADAMDANARVARSVGARIAAERAKSVEQGLWNPETGLPTGAGLGAAVRAYAGGMSDGGVGGMLGAIKAYHGSPHSFERFDISKIGTGEGAQAYGHGLYFAGNEEVARGYREGLSDPLYGGKPFDPEDVAHRSAFRLWRHEGDRDAAVASIDSDDAKIQQKLFRMRYTGADPASYPPYEKARAAMAESKRFLLDPKSVLPEITQGGHMYEVNLDVEPHQLLDWDKPLRRQGPTIQRAIIPPERAAGEHFGYDPYEFSALPGERQRALIEQTPPSATRRLLSDTGGVAYDRLATEDWYSPFPEAGRSGVMGGPSQEKASQQLRAAGIPGIKYLDQGSRSAGEGTSNYVMFDPDLIKIIRQYAVPGIAGASAAGLDWLPTGYEPAWTPTDTEAKP